MENRAGTPENCQGSMSPSSGGVAAQGVLGEERDAEAAGSRDPGEVRAWAPQKLERVPDGRDRTQGAGRGRVLEDSRNAGAGGRRRTWDGGRDIAGRSPGIAAAFTGSAVKLQGELEQSRDII